MTESELREIVESQGLTGMTAHVFAKNRVYTGMVERINVTTLLLTNPKVAMAVQTESKEMTLEPYLAGTKHLAISISHIEAIGF